MRSSVWYTAESSTVLLAVLEDTQGKLKLGSLL